METYANMLKDVRTIHDEWSEFIHKHTEGFTCQHQNIEITRRVVRGGAVQFVRQCLTCGESIGSPISKTTIPENQRIRDFDANLKQQWEMQRKEDFERTQKGWPEKIEQRKNAFWNRYDEYLESPQWKAKREKVLRRANYLCEACLERKAVIVHHTTYEHVGHEFLFELVAVCNQCHELIHAKNQ